MIACLAVKFDFIPQRATFIMFLGSFLFGVGQWINHPIQCTIGQNDLGTYTTKGYHRKSTILGVCLELLGGVIFVVEIYKIMVAK